MKFLTCLILVEINTKYTQQKPSCVIHKNILMSVLMYGANFCRLGGPVANDNSTVVAKSGYTSKFSASFIFLDAFN